MNAFEVSEDVLEIQNLLSGNEAYNRMIAQKKHFSLFMNKTLIIDI